MVQIVDEQEQQQDRRGNEIDQLNDQNVNLQIMNEENLRTINALKTRVSEISSQMTFQKVNAEIKMEKIIKIADDDIFKLTVDNNQLQAKLLETQEKFERDLDLAKQNIKVLERLLEEAIKDLETSQSIIMLLQQVIHNGENDMNTLNTDRT